VNITKDFKLIHCRFALCSHTFLENLSFEIFWIVLSFGFSFVVDIRQSGDDIESSRVEELEEIVGGANIDKTEAEKQLEEPNLEGYKSVFRWKFPTIIRSPINMKKCFRIMSITLLSLLKRNGLHHLDKYFD
jgi:hypothetical protein